MLNHYSDNRAIERKARMQHRLANTKKGLKRINKGLIQLGKNQPVMTAVIAGTVATGVLLLGFWLLRRSRLERGPELA